MDTLLKGVFALGVVPYLFGLVVNWLIAAKVIGCDKAYAARLSVGMTWWFGLIAMCGLGIVCWAAWLIGALFLS